MSGVARPGGPRGYGEWPVGRQGLAPGRRWGMIAAMARNDADRERRLAEALRANLARRKAQGRAAADAPAAVSADDSVCRSPK